MAKTLAQLKRDANTGEYYASLEIRNGEICTPENTPKRLQGKRQIVGYTSAGLVLLLKADETKMEDECTESTLFIQNAKLTEYTDDSLKTYLPGYRQPNSKEQSILAGWENIRKSNEYQQDVEIDCMTDSSSCYYKELSFFCGHDAEYLFGHKKQHGCILDITRKNNVDKEFIRDDSVRGELCMQYRITRKESV